MTTRLAHRGPDGQGIWVDPQAGIALGHRRLAIAAWGIEAALRRATGMFVFALWNRASRVLTLARDRIGEKPLHYGRIGDALVFASELKALRGYPGFDGTVDRDALCLYLRQSSVPAPHTVYRGIGKLPPGTYIQFEHAHDTPRVRAYWTLEQAIETGRERPFDGSADETVGQLDAILREAVARQMEADVFIRRLPACRSASAWDRARPTD